MVFYRDEGSVFEAPLEAVWEFVGSGDTHSGAHRHRKSERKRLDERSGQYSWEQEFDGAPTRFSMRWTVFPPLGIGYDVLEGPFRGSSFFLYYVPLGPARTGVNVVGEFTAPDLPDAEIPAAVDRFFSLEYDQDHAGIREFVRRSER